MGLEANRPHATNDAVRQRHNEDCARALGRHLAAHELRRDWIDLGESSPVVVRLVTDPEKDVL